MGNSGLECDCDFDQWLGKLITSVGQCVRRTLIACQSVILCCNWQLDEAGVPSDTVARWERQRRKGQRDHKMGWGNGSDNGLTKAKGDSYLSLAQTFKALEMERGTSWTDFICPKTKKNKTKGKGLGGCRGQRGRSSERKLAMWAVLSFVFGVEYFNYTLGYYENQLHLANLCGVQGTDPLVLYSHSLNCIFIWDAPVQSVSSPIMISGGLDIGHWFQWAPRSKVYWFRIWGKERTSTESTDILN